MLHTQEETNTVITLTNRDITVTKATIDQTTIVKTLPDVKPMLTNPKKIEIKSYKEKRASTNSDSIHLLDNEGIIFKEKLKKKKSRKSIIKLNLLNETNEKEKVKDMVRRDGYGNEIMKGPKKVHRVTFGDQVGKKFKETVDVECYKLYNIIEHKKHSPNCCGKCLLF
jgi:hypothetical protein